MNLNYIVLGEKFYLLAFADVQYACSSFVLQLIRRVLSGQLK